MEIREIELGLRESGAEAVVLPFFEDLVPTSTAEYTGSGLISEGAKKAGFEGKQKQVFSTQDSRSGQLMLFVGLGPRNKFNMEVLRRSYSAAYAKLKESKVSTVLILTPGAMGGEGFEAVYALKLTLYSFDEFKSEKKKSELITALISSTDPKSILERASAVADATNFTRDIANLPPSRGTPTLFEERAKAIGKVKTTVLTREDFLKLGMGGIEGVSRAATEPAKMIIMEYGPAEEKPLLLVGKGITFDSGGISIKPSEAMDEMKFDKCGASAVLGLLKLASDLNLKKHIIGIMPLTENLPGGNAYKPGDILKHYNGKTSEVLSTDAEGRLVLADALSYGAEKYKPSEIIDFATLTGACVVALGNNIAGLMGTSDELKQRIRKASERSWERVWELPIDEDFMDQIKSEVADIKNTGGREGGAETAGAFLRHFVGDIPWAHIDIAGTAWTQSKTAKMDYLPKGATGYGVRLIYEYLGETN